MSQALHLKAIAIGWLRFGKRLPIVCTEVGRWNADVMGFSAEQAVEVEIKTSKADLKAEFKNKVSKHHIYANSSQNKHVPNLFYFLVPTELEDAALEIVGNEAPKAGVAVANLEADRYSRDLVKVAKRATKLRDAPPAIDVVHMAIARSSSELAGLYWWNVDFLRRFEATVERGAQGLIQLAARAAGTLDYEEPTSDLELRAQELAAAVDGIVGPRWLMLKPEEKQRWVEAAVRLLSAQYVNAQGWLREPKLF